MKNLLMIVIDCARTEKTLIDFPKASPGTRRSASLPFLDSLREKGTTWTNMSAVSSTTTPNFASFFTGLLPIEHGIKEHSRHSLRRDVVYLPEILKQQGYNTYSEMTGPLIPEAGLDRGFDLYRCRERDEYLHQGFSDYLRRFMPEMKEPWFFCLHLWEAHTPYQNPAPFNDPKYGNTPYDRALSLVDAELGELFEELDLQNTALVVTSDHGERLPEDYVVNAENNGRDWQVIAARRHFVQQYRGAFEYDAWFDFVRDALGEIDARIYAHCVVGHGFHLTEDLIRVPLVIVDPERCTPGAVIQAQRSQKDLFHTLLDLAGASCEAGEAPAGDSLLDHGGSEKIYVEANGSGGRKYESRCYLRGARTDRWKYWRVEGASREHRVLWDLKFDPRETRNVIAAHPEAAADLDAFVDQCLARRWDASPETLDSEDAARIEAKMRELGYL
jgi:arylsulfatase A-like enzyme